MISDDSCVCCGEYAGEGRQVCIICERAASRGERSKRVQELEAENKRLRSALETLAEVEWDEWEEDDMSAIAFRYVLLEQAGVPEESWECCENVPGIGEFLRQVLGGNWGTGDIKRPTIVCLCGSTRFGDAFQDANLKETLEGKIVLSIGCNMKSDSEIFGHLPADELQEIKTRLDDLHSRKIEMADEVLILNVDGYIGESTSRELTYARELGKAVRFLEGGGE